IFSLTTPAPAGPPRPERPPPPRVAESRGVPRAQVALAWLLHQDTVTAPIVGAAKPSHIEDAVAAVDLVLTDKELQQLAEPYTPHPIAGH
ncbi:aldo/keto reductase, partial [Streptomyces pseudogriseolus]|uniref:aldo/keto reductase n=1 Tax=Streptomyces pseudogriseolus TaxID=36817 RepID=UPI0036B47A42